MICGAWSHCVAMKRLVENFGEGNSFSKKDVDKEIFCVARPNLA